MKKIIIAVVGIMVLAILGGVVISIKSKAVMNDKKVIVEFVNTFKYFDSYSTNYYNLRLKSDTPDNALHQKMVDSLTDVINKKNSNDKLESAKSGFIAANTMVELSANDPLEASSTDSLAQLVSVASSIKNMRVREQALKIASLATTESKSAKDYQGTFRKKYTLMSKMFQVVIDSEGDLNNPNVTNFMIDFNSNTPVISADLDMAESNTRSLLLTLSNEYKNFIDIVKSENLEVSDMNLVYPK